MNTQTATPRVNTAVTSHISKTKPDKFRQLWAGAPAVMGWREVFHGKTNGHVFAGSTTATVSTRISDPVVLDVLTGLVAWETIAPGATVSQLVLSPDDPTQWLVAYVAERRGIDQSSNAAESAPLDDVSFYLVAADGLIDASEQRRCAACHVQRQPAETAWPDAHGLK